MPEHGTRSNYVAGCRCEACTAANRAYAKRRPKEKAKENFNGGSYRVPPEKARAALTMLDNMGYSRHEIERLTGIKRYQLRNLSTGINKNGNKLEYVSRDTQDRLLSLVWSRQRKRASGQLVDARGYRHVLTIWKSVFTYQQLADMIGWNLGKIHNFAYSDRPNMSIRLAREISKAAPHIHAAYIDKLGIKERKSAKSWRELAAEREASGYVVNPYR